MSGIDEIGVSRPNRTAVVLWTGKELTEGDLRNLKADPQYWRAGDADPAYRTLVDQLHEIAHNSRRLALEQAGRS